MIFVVLTITIDQSDIAQNGFKNGGEIINALIASTNIQNASQTTIANAATPKTVMF